MLFNTIMVQLDIDSPAAPRTTYAQNLAWQKLPQLSAARFDERQGVRP